MHAPTDEAAARRAVDRYRKMVEVAHLKDTSLTARAWRGIEERVRRAMMWVAGDEADRLRDIAGDCRARALWADADARSRARTQPIRFNYKEATAHWFDSLRRDQGGAP